LPPPPTFSSSEQQWIQNLLEKVNLGIAFYTNEQEIILRINSIGISLILFSSPSGGLHLTTVHLATIASHAERTYPLECCGLLLGYRDSAGQKIVAEVWPTDNAWTAETAAEVAAIIAPIAPDPNRSHTQRDRYWIDPKVMLAAQQYGRKWHDTDQGLRQFDIIGIYHSHPDHPAVPSECDRALAWSCYSYLIVSVRQGTAKDLLCWRLDDSHQFIPEPMVRLPALIEGTLNR
jgi:proteasome lid subunit RPN8/RPN11